MTAKMLRTILVIAIAFAGSRAARADELTKEACVDAHSRGQDAREQGKLSLARKLFLTCAQSSCPAVVQNDCARFADDLTRMQPSLTFAARDAGGADLPDTTVYVDDVLVATRLDDGRPHDVDPGKHIVKFQNGSRETTVTIVVETGEKGRTVVANFKGGGGSVSTGGGDRSGDKGPRVTHPGAAKIVMIGGGIVTVAGAAITILGITAVPNGCSISTHQCGAPPGDKVFTDASSAVSRMNTGIAITGVGVAALTGGLIWYFKGAKTEVPEKTVAMPWVTPEGAGFAISGRY
jgi:hypothetical protein